MNSFMASNFEHAKQQVAVAFLETTGVRVSWMTEEAVMADPDIRPLGIIRDPESDQAFYFVDPNR